jgi:hypothetical protein
MRLVAALLGCWLAFLAHAEEGERKPPFIATPGDVVERMLALAGTGPEDLVVDLGSGDGRIVITAAQRFGARGLGIELDKKLVEQSRRNAEQAHVGGRVSFVEGDVLTSDISRATVVTVYLLPSLIDRLQPRFVDELKPGTRIVSHAFQMVGWKPDRIDTIQVTAPHPGQGDESTLFLWVVPADVRGTWRGGGWQLRIYQNYQEIEIEGGTAGKQVTVIGAALNGSEIVWQAGSGRFRGRVQGAQIVGEITEDGRRTPLVLVRVP